MAGPVESLGLFLYIRLVENFDSQSGRLVKIWVKRAHRGPMDLRASGNLVAGAGLEGSADQGGHRQVTLIEVERWKHMMTELNADIDPSARRANLLIQGIDLGESRGKLLQIGSSVVRILGETRPCERMEQALPGLRASMARPWNGGAFGEILTGGTIRVGDELRWVDSTEAEVDAAGE